MKEPVRPDFKELKKTLPAEEVKKLRQEYRKQCDEYWDSTALTHHQIPKRRTWVLLARKSDGSIIAYYPNGINSVFSRKYVKLYQSCYSSYSIRGVRDGKFQMKNYREYNERLPKDLCNKRDAFQRKHPEYDFFVSRVGSKKCPIKINWKEFHEKNSKSSATFKEK